MRRVSSQSAEFRGVALQEEVSAGGWVDRLRSWFPDREFFMRSQGQVRFIKISSRVQMTAAAVVAALGIGWAGSMGVMAWNQHQATSELASFESERAKVATAQERLDAKGCRSAALSFASQRQCDRVNKDGGPGNDLGGEAPGGRRSSRQSRAQTRV